MTEALPITLNSLSTYDKLRVGGYKTAQALKNGMTPAINALRTAGPLVAASAPVTIPLVAAAASMKGAASAAEAGYQTPQGQQELANHRIRQERNLIPAPFNEGYYMDSNDPSKLYSEAEANQPVQNVQSVNTTDITPTVHMDESGNFSIGLTPQNTSLIPPSSPASPSNIENSPSIDINAMAKDVIAGKYKSGADRKKALGDNYTAVQARVNELLKGSSVGVSKKSSKAKEPSVTENLNKSSGNWMDSLSGLLPLLAIGAGAYYWGKH